MLPVWNHLLLWIFNPGWSQRGNGEPGCVCYVQRGAERDDAGDEKVKVLHRNRTEKSTMDFSVLFCFYYE